MKGFETKLILSIILVLIALVIIMIFLSGAFNLDLLGLSPV